MSTLPPCKRVLFLHVKSFMTESLYRNQSIDLQSKSMDWFLYDNGLRHERVKCVNYIASIWKKTNVAKPVLPPITDHGWNEDGSLT